MHFLNPWLLFGLLGTSVPIVIHLLNRFRYRDIDWAAMELLRRALVVRSRRVRIEDLLLLALRCLVIALVALAASRPTLTPQGAAWLGGGTDVGTVIAIDASFSMDHKPGVYSRFDRVMTRVREVLKTLKPGDPVTVVAMGDRPRVLFRNSGYEADRLAAVLETAAPLPERVNLDACLEEIENLVKEIKAPSRECYLVSDAQTLTWERLSDHARESLSRIATAGRVFFLPVAGDQAENLAITRFELESGMVRKGSLVRYAAGVANNGQRAYERVTITLYAGDKAVDQRVIGRIEPGKTEEVPLFVRFDKPGDVRLTARVADDDLNVDNVRHLVASVRPQVRILCIEGTPSSDLATSEVSYLLTALAPRRTDTAQDPIEVDRVGWLDLSSRRLADYHIAILVDVPELREDKVRAIGQFVSDGGGLIAFLGPNTQPAVVNKNLLFQNQPLLPGTILEVKAESEGRGPGWAIEPVAGHPLARAVAGLSREILDDARVERFFPLELAAGAQAAIKVGEGANDVLVAEKRLGRGSVVLLTTTADRKWTDIVAHPAYPMLVHEMVRHLGRQLHERPLVVGEPLVLPLPVKGDSAAADSVIFHEPDGSERAVKTVRRDGQVLAELGPTEQAGFYELVYTKEASGLPVAVNLDPAESDVVCLADSAQGEAFQGLALAVVRETDDLDAAIRRGRIGREMWWGLLLAAVAFLLLEGYLAYRFTRGEASGTTGPHPVDAIAQPSTPALTPQRQERAHAQAVRT